MPKKIVSAPMGAVLASGGKYAHHWHAVELDENEEPGRVLCKRAKAEHILADHSMYDAEPVSCPVCLKKMGRKTMKKNPRKRGKLTGRAKADFLARMVKGRKKVVRMKQAAPRKKSLGRRAARGGWKISARKGSGPKLFYGEHRFTNARPAHLFPSQQAAMSAARRLLQKYGRRLQGYQVAVESNF